MSEMTMRERVARAICRNAVLATARSLRVKPAPTEAWTDNRVEVRWREYLDVADDAIKAMRQPSPAMVDKAWAMIGSNLRYEEVYGHLVDAAMAESVPSAAAAGAAP